MSIKVMSRVWDHSKMTGSKLLVLLALADRADEHGICYPGIEYIAEKARIKRRHTQNILRELESGGEIITLFGTGRKNTNNYLIVCGMTQDEVIGALITRLNIDVIEAENIAKRVHHIAPIKKIKGALQYQKGCTPVPKRAHHSAPDPLLNINDSSLSEKQKKLFLELLNSHGMEDFVNKFQYDSMITISNKFPHDRIKRCHDYYAAKGLSFGEIMAKLLKRGILENWDRKQGERSQPVGVYLPDGAPVSEDGGFNI